MPITATMLYNLVQCPHRVSMDLHGDPGARDPVSPFVQLLWEKGCDFEEEVIEGLRVPFTNLRPFSEEERERRTLEAMRRGDPLIYGGRVRADDLLGDPDLLRMGGGGYVAGDIKSGAGLEGETDAADGRPKRHYAVQLSLYTDILERMGCSGGRTPFIWDIRGREVPYDLDAPEGERKTGTLWEIYRDALAEARAIAAGGGRTVPALAGICKLCRWRTACSKELEGRDDLTMLPELGRSRRDAMIHALPTVGALAAADLGRYIRGAKTAFRGIGPETLRKFQERAILQKTPRARPRLKAPVDLPRADTELFFDIETDPMRDICYLHGFVERRGGDTNGERYAAFLAARPTEAEERRVFAESWAYIRSARPCAIYYYSHYERTYWRKLQARYPDVASAAEIEGLFGSPSTVDLYGDIVRSRMVWPTRDHSVKTLAKYLGFKWRDTDPSGAASIEWYHRWVQSGDDAIRRRILDYNEDDCIAMRVLLDAIRTL
ncbi:MAG: TM0106 family RecB-like putative nuclease [bacterium]|nr:TM0106 family RecB-like putative nuclease [bacterium]